jgi:hypothetical protein
MTMQQSKSDWDKAARNWYRYAWVRDNGHIEFCQKADKCENFFAGRQWNVADKAALTAINRPALTINKIISTIANVMGEQIYQRAETAYLPASGAKPATANALTKLFKNIADRNQLEWKRSDMFVDGIIRSRGFLDIRMDFSESLQGDVSITKLNSKNVLVDPDADQEDPDTWNEVITTKWVTVDDIALLYSKKAAERLRGRAQSDFPFGYDSIDSYRDRFGSRNAHVNHMYGFEGFDDVNRAIRIVERQWRKLDTVLHFVYPITGESRVVPDNWDEDRVKLVAQSFGLSLVRKQIKRIRWTVTADDQLLHDDWSPYKHFTVVPYFPYFRDGDTIGLVENLIDPQELLNKAESQNLHIVNTSANSGWKLKTGALANMSVEELEERGAETGLVVEVNGDPEKDLVKITPNSVPTGHDRLAYKGEEHIKSISGVNDSMQGFDREDVASKAINAKKQSGKTNLVKPLDSLARTDYYIGRNVLDLIQEFYTAERIETVVKDSVTGETEELAVNTIDEATGEIMNDLTIGEYRVVVTSVPARETLEDSEFEQLVAMRVELGIKIPDQHIIMASRLRNKMELIKAITGDQQTPEAQAAAERQQRLEEATVAKEEAEALVKNEDAGLRRAKADQLRAETANPDGGTPGLDVEVADREQGREDVKADAEINRKDTESQAKIENMSRDADRKDIEGQQRMAIEAENAARAAEDERVARMTKPKESSNED